MAWFKRKSDDEKRAINYQAAFGADLTFGGGTYAGKSVSQDSSLSLIAVYACVSLISDTIAALPIDVYRKRAGVREPLPTPMWLEKPQTDSSRYDFLHRVLSSLLLDGNAYVAVLRNPESGSIVELVPINPLRVQVKADEIGRKLFVVDGRDTFTGRDIMHIPAFVRPGDLTGMSPIDVAREAIGLALTAEEFGARFFGQGSSSSGVIEVSEDLPDEAAKTLAKRFQARHGGARNAHLPIVLTRGAKWQSVTIAPEQAQFLETRRFQKLEIANLYRVPGFMIDPTVTSSWGTGVEEQNRRFVEYTLQAWLVRLEQALSALLPAPQFVKFNLDALLRGSTKERYDAYQVAISSGFMTVNEVRALEDMEPLPEPKEPEPEPEPEPVEDVDEEEQDDDAA